MGNIFGAEKANDLRKKFEMMVTYLKDHGDKETFAGLLENRDKVVTYLRKNNWTTAHMAGHTWVKHGYWHTYGKIKDNNLRNTKGIKIYSGLVYIGHFDASGNETYPYIYCAADEFVIYD